jgi:hypothetical protein
MAKNVPVPDPQQVAAALTRVGELTGAELSWEQSAELSGQLTVDGIAIPLPPLYGENADLFGIEGLLPTVPRADDRDKLLWRIFQEAHDGPTPDRWKPTPVDRELRQDRLAQKLQSRFADRDTRDAIALALEERFFSTKKVRMLLPVASVLPMNFAHSTGSGAPSRYRMFSGELLPFLLWDANAERPDAELAQTLLDVISGDADLTRLDLLFMEIAQESAREPDRSPDASALSTRYGPRLKDEMSRRGGAFCQPSLDLFRRDLSTVLGTAMPRQDKVAWLTLLVSLHVTARLYRLAVVMGSELDAAVASAAGVGAPGEAGVCPCGPTMASIDRLQSCALAGVLKFRVGTGRYAPVSLRDPCRTSYVTTDQHRLLSLPATLITANLALRAWAALDPVSDATRRGLGGLAAAINTDASLRRAHDAACAAMTVLHHAAHRGQTALAHELIEASRGPGGGPGIHALRQDVLKMRRLDLRHQSRDIVNQLMLQVNTGAGSLVNRNGTIGYYEIDERLLVLLVRLTCRDSALPFAEFVDALRAYGLSPQSTAERERLADGLERLGLLVRYSDAGESAYVHYTG